jgi:hypothetical protein
MATKTIPRNEALALMRQRCLALVDDEHSLCAVAARLGILCHGFSQWKFHELKERHDWIVRNRPGITRKELEELGNRWQLARQFVLGTELACDTQMREKQHRICCGWDDFSNADLGRCCEELTGVEHEVVPDPSA